MRQEEAEGEEAVEGAGVAIHQGEDEIPAAGGRCLRCDGGTV